MAQIHGVGEIAHRHFAGDRQSAQDQKTIFIGEELESQVWCGVGCGDGLHPPIPFFSSSPLAHPSNSFFPGLEAHDTIQVKQGRAAGERGRIEHCNVDARPWH